MRKKIFIIFFFLALLIWPQWAKAESQDCRGKKQSNCDMGAICSSNTDCKSNDCEKSTKTYTNGERMWFCDCGEVDGSGIPFVPNTSESCANQYGGTKENWLCKDGASFTWDLDYCINKINNNDTRFPIPTTEAKITDVVFDSAGLGAKSVSEIQAMMKTPATKISIPGLNFSEPKVVDEGGIKYIYIPFVGEYIAAFYKWLVVAIGVFAVVRFMQAGFSWMMAAGAAEKIANEKKKMLNAVAGVLLAVGSYILLYTINPNLVQFNNLRVQYVETIGLDFEDIFPPGESSGVLGTATGVAVSGTDIESLIGALPSQYAACSPEAAIFTAEQLHKATVCVGSCHCAWTASRFLKYIGCSSVIEGNASLLGVILDKNGWTTTEIIPQNRNNLPVGLLFDPGHVGISLGKGQQFQSGGKKEWAELNKRGNGQCPAKQKDAQANPGACNFCAKITPEAPGTGRFMGGVCESNQAWAKGSIWTTYWKAVVHPISNNTATPAKITCCFQAGGKNFKENISATLCKFLKDGKQCS